MQNILALSIAADLVDAIVKWQKWLRFEKRVSEHTVASYKFDIDNLLNFIGKHRGRQINLGVLSSLTLGRRCATPPLQPKPRRRPRSANHPG